MKFGDLEKRFTWEHGISVCAIIGIMLFGSLFIPDLWVAHEESQLRKDCEFAYKKPCKIVIHKTAVPKDD